MGKSRQMRTYLVATILKKKGQQTPLPPSTPPPSEIKKEAAEDVPFFHSSLLTRKLLKPISRRLHTRFATRKYKSNIVLPCIIPSCIF